MAYQMIYTSIKSGLVAGRSGFCTAARHREIGEALVGRIENLSGQYDRGSGINRQGSALPVIFAHRIVEIRGREWHLLMRIGDAGNDYSGRTNHIAHTFVLDLEEVSQLRLTPAEVMLHLIREGRWMERYTESAKFFGTDDDLRFNGKEPLVSLPAKNWLSLTGAAANAALLLEPRAEMGAGVVNSDGCPPGELLKLFAESQLLASPDRSNPGAFWSKSFTTLMQSAEQRGDFDWYGCDYNSPVHMQMLKANRFLIELGRGLASPSGRYADIAEGRAVVEEVKPSGRMETAVMVSIPEAAIVKVGADSVILPSATLGTLGGRPEFLAKKEKKRGIPAWILLVVGMGLIGLVAAVFFALFGKSEGAKLADEWEESLRNEPKNWTKVQEELAKHGDSRTELREDAKFCVIDDTIALAEKYQWILKNPGSAPESAGVKNGADYLKSLEDIETALLGRYAGEKVKMQHLPFLTELKDAAAKRVASYEATRESLAKDWATLLAGKVDGLNIEKLSEGDLDWFVEEVADLRKARKIVKPFAELRGKKFESEEEVEKARISVEKFSNQLNDLVAVAEDKSWKEELADLNIAIGSFRPELEKKAGPDLAAVAKIEVPKELPKEVPKEDTKITIPITYFWNVTEGSRYDYSGVTELAGRIPEFLFLTPANNHTIKSLSEIAAAGRLVGQNLYHEDTMSTTVFKATPGKVFEPTVKMPAAYKGGFFLAFAGKSGAPPDFQIVAQRASISSAATVTEPAFLTLPLEVGLKKEDGKISLSEEALGLLRQLLFPNAETNYLFLWVQEGGQTAEWREKDPGLLCADLVGGLDQQIAQARTATDNYAELEKVEEDFEREFGKLGERLFCDPVDKKNWIYKLDVKSDRAKNGDSLHIFTEVPDKEADGATLYKTLEEFRPKANKGRPLLIDYVNYSLNNVFRAWSLGRNSDFSKDDADFFEWQLCGFTKEDGWGPKDIETALKGWLEITKKCNEKDSNWIVGTPTDVLRNASQEMIDDRLRLYPASRYRSKFFERWREVFTEANVEIARKKLLGGEFKKERLDELKAALASLEKDRESIAGKPLAELGQFQVVVQSGTEIFRVFRITGHP